MKCALVIGHKASVKGCYNSNYDIWEFDFNKRLSQKIVDEYKGGVDIVRVYRDTYKTLPQKINKLNPDFIVSMHCNALDKETGGTCVLYYHTSRVGKNIAQIFQSIFLSNLELRDLGTVPRTVEDNGGFLLAYSKAPCIICEPFFLDYDDDYEVAIERYEGLVNAYITGINQSFHLLGRNKNMKSLTVSTKGIEKIIEFEVTSKEYYQGHYTHPIWPGGASGVTIGIGYDLGQNSPEQVVRDWRDLVPEAELNSLLSVVGETGHEAKACLRDVQHVSIDYESASTVFMQSTLPRFARYTKNVYPGVENLYLDVQVALLSLIYNRGPGLKGDRRTEMRRIKDLVLEKDLPGIARELRSMKRLWEDEDLPGLLRRRDEEAILVENSDREYEPGEVLNL